MKLTIYVRLTPRIKMHGVFVRSVIYGFMKWHLIELNDSFNPFLQKVSALWESRLCNYSAYFDYVFIRIQTYIKSCFPNLKFGSYRFNMKFMSNYINV